MSLGTSLFLVVNCAEKETLAILSDDSCADVGSAGVNTQIERLCHIRCFVPQLNGKWNPFYDPCFSFLEKDADMTAAGRRYQRFSTGA